MINKYWFFTMDVTYMLVMLKNPYKKQIKENVFSTTLNIHICLLNVKSALNNTVTLY